MGAIGLLGQQAMAGATIAGQEPKFILGLYLNAVVVRAPPSHVLRPGRANAGQRVRGGFRVVGATAGLARIHHRSEIGKTSIRDIVTPSL